MDVSGAQIRILALSVPITLTSLILLVVKKIQMTTNHGKEDIVSVLRTVWNAGIKYAHAAKVTTSSIKDTVFQNVLLKNIQDHL